MHKFIIQNDEHYYFIGYIMPTEVSCTFRVYSGNILTFCDSDFDPFLDVIGYQ